MVNVKSNALVVALPKTQRDVEAEALNDTLLKVTAEALIHALDGTQSEVEPETVSTTLVEVTIKAQIDALVDKLSQVEGEKVGKNNRGADVHSFGLTIKSLRDFPLL